MEAREKELAELAEAEALRYDYVLKVLSGLGDYWKEMGQNVYYLVRVEMGQAGLDLGPRFFINKVGGVKYDYKSCVISN